MAGASAGLPAGVRLSDHISLGVIARAFPPDQVRRVLSETGRASERERDLPAQVMVYYAIALALYMGSSTREVLRCLLEGLRWLWGSGALGRWGGQGGGPERHLAGPHPPGRGATAPALRADGAPDCDARHQGGVVSGVAAGQPGRLLPGCGRHRGEPRQLRVSGRQPWRERFPAASLRGFGGERHACAVRRPPGPLRGWRDHAGP